MLNVKVSIIVPIYNREEMVDDFYGSVKSQTFDDWELLFIDDNSTDQTFEKILILSQIDSRVKALKNRFTKGPSGARNTGLDEASGLYIAYQDSDDEWLPFHLEEMVGFLDKHPEIDLMTADPLRKIKESNQVYHYDKLELHNDDYEIFDGAYKINPSRLFDIQLKNRAITTQTIVGKRDIIKSVRWNEELRAATDNLYNLELCTKNITVCHFPKYHVIYWAHGNNITNPLNTHDSNKAEFYQKNFAKFWNYLINNLDLNKEQIIFCKKNLSRLYAWHLAYHIYEKNNRNLLAFKFYIKAFLLNPLDILIFKKILTLPFKVLFKLALNYN